MSITYQLAHTNKVILNMSTHLGFFTIASTFEWCPVDIVHMYNFTFIFCCFNFTTKEPKHKQNIVYQSNNINVLKQLGNCVVVCVRVFPCSFEPVCECLCVQYILYLPNILVAFVRCIWFKRYTSMHKYLTKVTQYAITWSTYQLEFPGHHISV